MTRIPMMADQKIRKPLKAILQRAGHEVLKAAVEEPLEACGPVPSPKYSSAYARSEP